ncbi:MAG: CDP-glucose 4,6-dehydratase [Actinomycetota bacterium]
MHYFVTGHTGFKGSWLVMLLRQLGHEVSGYSLPPVEGGLFQLAGLDLELKHHFIGDIRNLETLQDSLIASKPDFAIHMAAQPLVLRSYEDPVETYTTNVDGTLNFLKSVSGLASPPVSLVITTDKVYRDDGKGSYVESDPLGGHDPYSASKAMADILTQSWAATNPNLRLHIARAGNVIGAFDASENRLIPDVIRALKSDEVLRIRYPFAVRPWQHVLDCLAGYLLLLNKVKNGASVPIALNFGPDPESIRSVSEVLDAAKAEIPELKVELSDVIPSLKETQMLTLDSQQALTVLDWENRIDFQRALQWSLEGISTDSATEIVTRQIKEFLTLGHVS